jgi:acid phosphatase family membrane protein YuiD
MVRAAGLSFVLQEMALCVFQELGWKPEYFAYFMLFVVIIAYDHGIVFREAEIEGVEYDLYNKGTVDLRFAVVVHRPQVGGRQRF